MKVDTGLVNLDLAAVPARAAALEAEGYDGLYTFEGPHDPFLPLLLAAEHTERVELMTAIAIAFARNPMSLAYLGEDLQRASHGRMILGLGSQIRPHIERRFSMDWSQPAARMRELVTAIRAIWNSWHTGEALDVQGEFYRHTLMTPFFDPGPSPHGPPRIALAGVGPLMTEVGGEVADLFLVHPFGTSRSIDELTLPALARGAARAARPLSEIEISFPVMVATADADADIDEARAQVRSQLAFYGSTPAYRVVLDVHGWGDVQPELNRLSKQGRWDEMSSLLSDELVDEFAVIAPTDRIAPIIAERYGSNIHRIALNSPFVPDPERWSTVVAALRAHVGPPIDGRA